VHKHQCIAFLSIEIASGGWTVESVLIIALSQTA